MGLSEIAYWWCADCKERFRDRPPSTPMSAPNPACPKCGCAQVEPLWKAVSETSETGEQDITEGA